MFDAEELAVTTLSNLFKNRAFLGFHSLFDLTQLLILFCFPLQEVALLVEEHVEEVDAHAEDVGCENDRRVDQSFSISEAFSCDVLEVSKPTDDNCQVEYVDGHEDEIERHCGLRNSVICSERDHGLHGQEHDVLRAGLHDEQSSQVFLTEPVDEFSDDLVAKTAQVYQIGYTYNDDTSDEQDLDDLAL